MKHKNKILYSILFISIFFSLSVQRKAQATPNITTVNPNSTASSSGGAYTNQEKIPGAQPTNDFIQYLKDVINFGFAIIGILALFMLIIGAYQYLMAAGSGNASDAKDTITSALLGLILGLCAWIILAKINPDLVNMNPIKQITGGGSTGVSTGTLGAAGSAQYNGGATAVSGTTAQRIASYQSDITAASQRYGVPENVIKAMIDVESSGNPNAKNPNSTASGLMQLTRGAATDVGVTDVFNPSQSIDGGTHYLANDIKQAGSVENGIAAYYTGIGNFNKAGSWQNCNSATVAYVNKVMGKAQSYSN